MQAPFFRRRAAPALLAALLAAAALSGCQTGLPVIGGPEAAAERAGRQSRQGDHAGAARSFESAARAAAEGTQNPFWLAAADEWLRAAVPDAAEAALASLAPPLSPADARERARLAAEIALARGDASRARELLGAIEGDNAATLATRARVQFANRDVASAVASLVERERLLATPADRLDNQRRIVEGVSAALLAGADLRVPRGADRVQAGWIELGRILSDARAGALGVRRRLQSWRERFPNHPADPGLWRGLLEREAGAGAGGDARQVALLLPLSGRAAAAGLAVRDGFLAAYYDAGGTGRPRVRLYDVAASDAATAYLAAIADGSDFVVGPLTREDVAAVAPLADGRATTLALNFLPDGVAAPDRFYQYALSPEDEARLAARRIVADGHVSGVALVPQSDWGRRVHAAFADELSLAGGRIVDRADYVPSTADFNETLRRLLQTTGQRGSQPRPDAQFIFVAAQPVAGRLIRTQLRFNYLGHLPTYATSDVYDPTGAGNVDLDGVIFPDMPWVLEVAGPAAEARDRAERLWPGRGGQLMRLQAFGYDAWRLVGELGRLQSGAAGPLAGVTGRLSVDGEGRVRRELDWARLVKARPEPWPPPAAPLLPAP